MYRSDVVGSLLRPAALKDARAKRLALSDLKAVEDREIIRAIEKQTSLGLQAATDGEFRRAMWHFDFLEHLDGVESFTADHGIEFKGGLATVAKGLRVTGEIGFSAHPMLDHFHFLKENCHGVAALNVTPWPGA